MVLAERVGMLVSQIADGRTQAIGDPLLRTARRRARRL